jgi:DNA polymerase-3 subunit beta
MKVQITQENLHRALSTVSRVVGNRTTLPILANVLLHAKLNKLYFSATNLEIGITYLSGVKTKEEGKITIPAKLFLEYISTLPSGTVDLEVEKNSLKITTNHNQSTINGMDAEEFPSIPVITQGSTITLGAQELKTALSQVVLVASSDDSRPVLGGVYIYQKDDELVVVATDSYRLAEKIIKPVNINNKKQEPVRIVIPARSAQEVLRSIEEDTQEVTLVYDGSQAIFKIDTIEIVSRLIDGAFPDYQQLIPTDAQTVVTIDTKAFTSIAKTAGLFARESGGSVTITARSKNNTLSINSTASQIGTAASEAEAKVEGEETSVSVNSRYILDALGVINSETTTFSITGKVTPCLLRPAGSSSYLHLIMPLRS